MFSTTHAYQCAGNLLLLLLLLLLLEQGTLRLIAEVARERLLEGGQLDREAVLGWIVVEGELAGRGGNQCQQRHE